MITKKLIIIAVASVAMVFLLAGCEEPGDSEPLLVVGHHQESGEAVFTVDDDGNPAPSLETELIEKVAEQAGFRVRFYKVDYPAPDFSQIEDSDTVSDFFQAFVDALDQGSIDVVIGNFWVLSKRQEVVGYLTPHLPDGVGSETTPVAFCVREGNTELKTDLDAALTALDEDGTLATLREKYNLDCRSPDHFGRRRAIIQTRQETTHTMLPASASMSPLRREDITKSTPDMVKPVSPIISACLIGRVSACGYCTLLSGSIL